MPTTNPCNVECSVLIPARTLEDFPTDLDDCDACSTLAAWTVLWHPELLVTSQQIPAWHRADSPPEPQVGSSEPQTGSTEPQTGAVEPQTEHTEQQSGLDSDTTNGSFVGHLFITPTPSLDQLPDGYADRAKSAGAIWVTGPDRPAMLDQLKQAGLIQADLPPQTAGQRTIGMEDFFAAGFAALQIQIMTRRLRYTSNLDQIHLQTRVVDAATAFLEKRTAEAIEALHDVFDCLAEERDHYFTSDPHLIDLVLVESTTTERAIADPVIAQAAENDATSEDEGVLKTPVNVLIDSEAMDALAGREDGASQDFRGQIRDNKIGWAAGGPSSDVQFDFMDYADAARSIRESHRKASECMGVPPPVYGRLSGDTPSDMITAIASLGYAGVIPLNFAAGTGHAAEAKVVLPISVATGHDGEIEALTAKPIDASSDSAFLSIGAKLGESIDSGEIATGLLVHWPGQGCDSYYDLRRLASWSLSLGRFWKIGDYFTQGERPYHQGNLSAVGSDSPSELSALFDGDVANPITVAADRFMKSSVGRQDRLLGAIGEFLSPSDARTGNASEGTRLNRIAKSIGLTPDPDGDTQLVVNVNSIPLRVATEISSAPAAMRHIYSCERDRVRYLASVDVPAIGYSIARPAVSGEKTCAVGSEASGVGGWIRNQFLGRSSTIAQGFRLHNEFMEVEVSEKSGGVAGVYSGGERGNRFSMRLVAEGFPSPKSASESLMRCDDILVTKNTAAEGRIEAKGKLIVDGVEVANFVNRYSLVSGSRVLNVRVQLNRSPDCGDNQFKGNQWENYIAARVAVPEESSVCRALIRDKVHRSRGRRIVAPLGLVIDEAHRQTLISSDGYPLHRIVGKRFYDTLLMVPGQGSDQFNLRYGFDVAQPVAEAWSGLAPAKHLSVKANPGANASSWFANVGPREVLIGDMTVHRLGDNTVGVEVELIATRGKSCTAKLQFFRDPTLAYRVLAEGREPSGFPAPDSLLRSTDTGTSNEQQPLEIKDDANGTPMIRVPMNGHEVCRVMVVFDDASTNGDTSAKDSQ